MIPSQRVDIARICLINHYGGIYIDISILPSSILIDRKQNNWINCGI